MNGTKKCSTGSATILIRKHFRLTASIECSHPCVDTDTKRHAVSRGHSHTGLQRTPDAVNKYSSSWRIALVNSCTVKLNVDDVLSFFDERPADSKGHASGLIAVVGEELGSFLLCRHLEVMHACKSRMFTHEGKPITPRIGTNKGRRLDRWVLTESESEAPRLYQVEIKNWNAHSKDGKPLKLSADEAEIQQYRIDRWAEHWLEDKCEFRYEEAHKVLLRMKPPLKADD